ncbi:MAG: FAD-dependent monooxygenase [Actinophytocola sp.]|uniref:FAD-dependent monooxygenase n=1 Tax=Actinophytocola sp. TaxID=1872138 RepID=UPI003C749165
MEAIVAGGGIGGLAVAAGLSRRGWDVTVLERTGEFDVVGSAISLWPNAFRALEAVGATVGGERLGAEGGLRDWRGRWIVRMDDDEVATGHTAKAVVTHRHDLRTALLAQVPAHCRLAGVLVTGARVEGSRAVVEHDGGELSADLLIGADGVNSAVRRALWPDAAPARYSKHTAWRMILPRPETLMDAGVEIWAETWGPGAVFGMFPMGGDRVYCYGTGAVPAGQRGVDGELAELRRRFEDWCEPIPTVLAAATEERVLRNDIYYLPRLPTYVHGPVALLGDAAHAMTPNLGQGGCQALEDAATLSVAVETQPDLATALRRYDELRRPRTQALGRKALLSRDLSHLSWGPARAARNAVLRTLPRSVFVRSLAQPFSWRPEDGLVRT